MSFSADAIITIREFGNADVTLLLAGVPGVPFRAIFDESVETPAPYHTERTVPKPLLTALTSDLAAAVGDVSFSVLRDGDVTPRAFTFDGKPRSDGQGLTTAFLAVKK